MAATIEIVNLNAFRRDLKRAIDGTPREMTKALKAAGAPVIKGAAALSPSRTGRLRASYKASVRGTTGFITSSVPYGAGAEWGRRGHWAGFQRYGPRGGRFAGRAVDEKADEIVALLTSGLAGVLTIYGWGH